MSFFAFFLSLLSLCCAFKTSDFNATLSKSTVYYAAAAYCDNVVKRMTWSCKACDYHPTTRLLSIFNGTDSLYGFLAVNDDEEVVVLSFRGTVPTNLHNWLLNFNALKTNYLGKSGIKVHKGFYSGWLSMKARVLLTVAQAMKNYPNYSLLLTGHSLGGALTAFAAVEIPQHVHFSSLYQTYTYGTPRIGDPGWQQYVNNTIGPYAHYRVIHDEDPVPHVPPYAARYRHAPQEVWYNQPMSMLRRCDLSGEDPNCADSVHSWEWSISHHLYYYNVHVGTFCDANDKALIKI